jgi:D-3-phosphoglycerate dehydrogenase
VPRILVGEPDDFSVGALAVLREVGEVELRRIAPHELRGAFGAYDVVWLRLAHRVDAAALVPPLRCRILAVPVTGLDHIDLDACNRAGVEVVSLRGETEALKEVRATAELALGLALALLRRIPAASRDVLAGRWNRDAFRGHELYRKTAGIVGVGRLGSIVAGYFRALGMRVLGYDPRPDFPHEAAERVGDLGALFAASDVVSVHASYGDGTRGLVSAAVLARAKPGAVLVNTARGGFVDERALLEALASGRLAGAALDVLSGEPAIDARHPLVAWAASHDNLLVVPHIGGNTHESFARTEEIVARKVARVWSGGR